MSLYQRISDPTDIRELSEQMAVWEAAGNPKALDWQPYTTPVVEPVVPTFTAEGWLDAQNYGGARSTTLLYLKIQLQSAGKTSAKLAAAQAWLDTIIAIGAADPEAQHSDLPVAPYTFAETTQEALAALQS